jgi:hypothetical protein
MPSIHEQISEQFGALHRRLKGWQVFPEPVTPEPPFQPFSGYRLAPVVDDGRVQTVGSSLLAGLSRWLGGKSPASPEQRVEEEEPTPTPLVRTDLIELQTSLPANLNLPREAFEAFLSQLAACREPLSFELVGQPEQIHAQFTLAPSDAPLVRRQLGAYFPEAVFIPTHGTLEVFAQEDRHHAIVEFGLARECLFPLAGGGKLDPFIGLIAALGELREDERAVYQVLFQPCRNRWADSLVRSVTDQEGRSLFANRPEFAGLAREKVAEPLYAAPALPRPSWACLAQELGPARLLAAVVCTHTLAVVSLQVVDKALSASAPAMATLQSSAVAAATALFAAHLREAR